MIRNSARAFRAASPVIAPLVGPDRERHVGGGADADFCRVNSGNAPINCP
ncbi:hypothetical protein ACFCX0_10990 [Streptomyces sp. NPDC056352]